MAEPTQESLQDLVEACGREQPEAMQGAHGRKRGDSLDQEGTRLEERRSCRDLERRTAQRGGVRDDGDQGRS